MHMVSSARALSPLHTHSPWSRSDDPEFARPDIGRCSNVQVSDEAVRFARSLGPLPLILVFLHFLFLLLFLDPRISHLACHSIPVIS